MLDERKVTMGNKPIISDDPMYQLLREGKIDEFNNQKKEGECVAFSHVIFVLWI